MSKASPISIASSSSDDELVSRALRYDERERHSNVKREFGETPKQEKKRRYEWDSDASDEDKLLTSPVFPPKKRTKLVECVNSRVKQEKKNEKWDKHVSPKPKFVSPMNDRKERKKKRSVNSREANEIEYKAKEFDREWKENKKYFSVRSNQERYGRQLIKEAEKVRDLPMKISCYTNEGLLKLGLGQKTVEILEDLIDETKYWEAPKNQRNSLFLTLE